MIETSRQQRKALERENESWPKTLVEVPKDRWPPGAETGQVRVWRSRDFVVQEFPGAQPAVVARLSVCRTRLVNGRWEDGIGWEDLQAIKDACGYSGFDAVELYPASADVVNVANMRHLWVLSGAVQFAWRNGS